MSLGLKTRILEGEPNEQVGRALDLTPFVPPEVFPLDNPQTDILNGHKGPLTPVPAQDADRLRGCEQSVSLQVPAVGTGSPLAVQHIRFEGTPAYLLVYGGPQPIAVVVGDTCTATVTQVLFSKPL